MKLRQFPLLSDENIDPSFTIAVLEVVLRADPDLQPPFVLVARRAGRRVTMRMRHLASRQERDETDTSG